MSWLDIAIVLILFVTALAGFLRGAMMEIVSLAAIIVGYILAGKAFSYIGGYFTGVFGNSDAAQITTFIIICILSITILAAVGRVIKSLLRAAGGNFLDRILGTAVGFAKGALYVSFLIIFTALLVTEGNDVLKRSRAAPNFYNFADLAYSLLPKEMKDLLGDKLNLTGKKIIKAQQIKKGEAKRLPFFSMRE